MSAYDIETGNLLWSIKGNYRAVVVGRDVVYALTSGRTIYGNGVQVLDHGGKIIKQSTEINGYDIVIDPNENFMWLVGSDIKKCDTDLSLVKVIKPVKWCAVSVDICADGSIWVAERDHSDVLRSRNRLIKIDRQGTIIRSIPLNELSPMCVRVDKSDENVWVTGIRVREYKKLSLHRWPPGWERDSKYIGSRTRKYSAQGELMFELKCGGGSIDIDALDGSVWIADRDTPRLYLYSSKGKKLDTSEEVSLDQKRITILPGRKEGD
jgi:hypothetical protein